jgi:hypothetical protein
LRSALDALSSLNKNNGVLFLFFWRSEKKYFLMMFLHFDTTLSTSVLSKNFSERESQSIALFACIIHSGAAERKEKDNQP